jgi:hypothetical protein
MSVLTMGQLLSCHILPSGNQQPEKAMVSSGTIKAVLNILSDILSIICTLLEITRPML